MESTAPATTAVDLSDGDAVLNVDISDALSERDWVKFTVHTKTSIPRFVRPEFSVIRLHEEFIWWKFYKTFFFFFIELQTNELVLEVELDKSFLTNLMFTQWTLTEGEGSVQLTSLY